MKYQNNIVEETLVSSVAIITAKIIIEKKYSTKQSNELIKKNSIVAKCNIIIFKALTNHVISCYKNNAKKSKHFSTLFNHLIEYMRNRNSKNVIDFTNFIFNHRDEINLLVYLNSIEEIKDEENELQDN